MTPSRPILEQIEILRRALGAGRNIRASKLGYQNRYVPGPDARATVETLAREGLMVRGVELPNDRWVYHATEIGARAVGLDPAQVKEAMKHVRAS